jgi:hypothetical protein
MSVNILIPVVFFCAFSPEEPHDCNGQTALYKHALSPVQTVEVKEGMSVEVVITNPITCLQAGWIDVSKEMESFKTEHPNKDLEFRVVCKRLDQKT